MADARITVKIEGGEALTALLDALERVRETMDDFGARLARIEGPSDTPRLCDRGV